MKGSQPESSQRLCPMCGEVILSRAKVHPHCAAAQPASAGAKKRKRKAAPQKTCAQCGQKAHVRTLVCPGCGAMF